MSNSTCIKLSNGSEIWMNNKKLHRTDGPAVWNSRDRTATYYINGVNLDFKSWINSPYCSILPKDLTFALLKYSQW